MFVLSLLAVACLASVASAKPYHGLSFDSEYFMCEQWDLFCETVLDDVDCGHGAGERQMEGCLNYPTEKNVANWVGACSCATPYEYDAGTRVTQELLSNRVSPDLSWIMEPWNSGPPYDIILSYSNLCNMMLDRIKCPEASKTIVAEATSTTTPGDNFQCTCGTLTAPSSFVNVLMMDKMNDYNLRSTPIFSNPVYLSVPLSICILLITGKIGAIIAVYLKLPPIIGFLLIGLGIQNILSPMFLKGAGFPYPSPASEIKLIALTIVLMRAGLAIKFDEIMANGLLTFLLCLIPYMAEFFTFMYFGKTFFPDFSTVTMGLFASIMAPLGPSVVISGLLNLMASPKRNPGYTGKLVLISSPIEAVLAIVLFGIFTNLEQTGLKNSLYPWVTGLPLLENCLLIPANLLFSTVMGIIVGYLCSKYIDWRSKQKSDYIWYRASKNPQMGSSTADLVFVLLVFCYTMMSLCTNQYIQQSSGVLVVFVASITVSKLADPQIVADIAGGLKSIWLFAEIFLFTLTGTSLSFDSSNGPLYGQRGLTQALMRSIVGIMFLGTAARAVTLGGIVLSVYRMLPPHRQCWQWATAFWLNLYIFQMPKATVQSTLGSVAYYQKIIPGAQGLNQGLIIAQATAFTVLVFAPLGALLTNYVGSPLAQYCLRLDKEAGWDEETRSYLKKDETEKKIEDEEAHHHEHHGLRLRTLSIAQMLEENSDEEEVAVGPHGEILHEPETIDHALKGAMRYVLGIDTHGSANRRRLESRDSVLSRESAASHPTTASTEQTQAAPKHPTPPEGYTLASVTESDPADNAI